MIGKKKNNMDFKNNISTTLEQSKRLLSLGVKPETADMVYHFTKSKIEYLQWELQPKSPTLRGEFWTPQRISKLASPFFKRPDGTPMTGEEVFDSVWGKDVPSWSLSRLMEMMPKEITTDVAEYHLMIIPFRLLYVNMMHGEIISVLESVEITQYGWFEEIIDMIERLIKGRHFNQGYLIHSNSSKTGKEDVQ